MRLLFVALVVCSSAALGQTLTLQVQERTAFTVGPTSCSATVPVTWQFAGAGANPCSVLKLWVTTSTSCGNDPGSTDLVLPDVPAGNVATPGAQRITFQPSQLPVFSSGDGGNTCGGASQIEQVHRVCGKVSALDTFTFQCNRAVTSGNQTTITYDAKPPAAPSISSVVGVDGALSVKVEASGSDVSIIRVAARRQGSTDVAGQVEGSVDQSTYRVTGLENGVVYEVTATAEDEAGNESAASEAQLGTPVKTRGLYEVYRQAGGSETGGCGAAGGGLAGGAVLAALGLWLFARRGRS
jgi:hypothetical protein